MQRYDDKEKQWIPLGDAIRRNAMGASGTLHTELPGLEFHRHTQPRGAFPHFMRPVVIVVAQGKKLIKFGDKEHKYGEGMCFVAGVNMPVTSCVLEASMGEPYISMSIYLDMGILGELAAKTPPQGTSQTCDISPGAMGLELDWRLSDTFLRLVDLISQPDELPVMGDILMRELHYRLLRSSAGTILRSYNIVGSQEHRILTAINWLRKNFKQPFLVENLAEIAHMAPTTLHKYFKFVTTLSPLQYQKRLRMDEAQRLMFGHGYDVTRAALEVGYESVTQFIREYKRLYGVSPHKNIIQLKKNNNLLKTDRIIS